MVAGLNLEWLGQQLKQRGVQRGGTIVIADRNGTVVSREPFGEKYIGRTLTDSLGRIGAAAAGSEDIIGVDGVPRIVGFIPASLTPFGLYVSSGISRSEAFGPIDRAAAQQHRIVRAGKRGSHSCWHGLSAKASFAGR